MSNEQRYNFSVGGKDYIGVQLNALEQFAISVKLMPIVPQLKPMLTHYAEIRRAQEAREQAEEAGQTDNLPPVPELDYELIGQLGQALGVLKDEERDNIMRLCLQSVFVQKGPGAMPVWPKSDPKPPADVNMVQMLGIVWNVVTGNLSSFGVSIPSLSNRGEAQTK